MSALGLAASVLALPASVASADTTPASTVSTPATLKNLGDGAWCWFDDPRAVHVLGQRDQDVVGWINTHGGVTVDAIDRSTGHQDKVIVAHRNKDDHSNPSFLVEQDKRITVFYSGHDGSHMYYRTTLNPEDVSTWGPERRLPSNTAGNQGFTYPNIVTLSGEGNRSWLFWRGGDWEPAFATRTPNGAWSKAKKLIDVPGQRPYVKVTSDGTDRIGLAFTNGHPRDATTSLYYMEYHGGELWSASGRKLGRPGRHPIRPSAAELVYDAGKGGPHAWVHDVAFDHRGHPVIVYATFPSVAHHQYWYARWNGRRWQRHHMVGAGPSFGGKEQQYSGGIVLDHNDPNSVYLSRKIGPKWQIERWVTGDGGRHWRHVQISHGRESNVRPVVVRGTFTGPPDVLWMRGHYGSYTTYKTRIIFDRGGVS